MHCFDIFAPGRRCDADQLREIGIKRKILERTARRSFGHYRSERVALSIRLTAGLEFSSDPKLSCAGCAELSVSNAIALYRGTCRVLLGCRSS